MGTDPSVTATLQITFSMKPSGKIPGAVRVWAAGEIRDSDVTLNSCFGNRGSDRKRAGLVHLSRHEIGPLGMDCAKWHESIPQGLKPVVVWAVECQG
jgi:hypothetical protein